MRLNFFHAVWLGIFCCGWLFSFDSLVGVPAVGLCFSFVEERWFLRWWCGVVTDDAWAEIVLLFYR